MHFLLSVVNGLVATLLVICMLYWTSSQSLFLDGGSRANLGLSTTFQRAGDYIRSPPPVSFSFVFSAPPPMTG